MIGCRQKEEEINWDKYWNPRLCVENIYSEAKESVHYTVLFNDAGHATVVEKRRISGSFFEYMELNQFPFDTQVRGGSRYRGKWRSRYTGTGEHMYGRSTQVRRPVF